MTIETNDQKYVREISGYQNSAEKYFWISVPFAALTAYFLINTLVVGLPESDQARVIELSKIGVSLLVWHELFSGAEGNVSKLKQVVRDYCHDKEEFRSPVKYKWTTKFIQKCMPLYDNTPLPPDL